MVLRFRVGQWRCEAEQGHNRAKKNIENIYHYFERIAPQEVFYDLQSMSRRCIASAKPFCHETLWNTFRTSLEFEKYGAFK